MELERVASHACCCCIVNLFASSRRPQAKLKCTPRASGQAVNWVGRVASGPSREAVKTPSHAEVLCEFPSRPSRCEKFMCLWRSTQQIGIQLHQIWPKKLDSTRISKPKFCFVFLLLILFACDNEDVQAQQACNSDHASRNSRLCRRPGHGPGNGPSRPSR
jgi:hypothetical protein